MHEVANLRVIRQFKQEAEEDGSARLNNVRFEIETECDFLGSEGGKMARHSPIRNSVVMHEPTLGIRQTLPVSGSHHPPHSSSSIAQHPMAVYLSLLASRSDSSKHRMSFSRTSSQLASSYICGVVKDDSYQGP